VNSAQLSPHAQIGNDCTSNAPPLSSNPAYVTLQNTPRDGNLVSTKPPASRKREADSRAASIRRQCNTVAQRKYRQRKIERIEQLEKALEEMTRERDELKLRLASKEAEAEVLKSMMGQGT
jgi:hypothetical protein